MSVPPTRRQPSHTSRRMPWTIVATLLVLSFATQALQLASAQQEKPAQDKPLVAPPAGQQAQEQAPPPPAPKPMVARQLQAQKIQGVIRQLAPRLMPKDDGQPREPTEPFAPPDRGKLRILRLATEAIEQEKFLDGIGGLVHLVQMDEDYFFQPEPGVRVYRSMKYEAKSLLAGLPEKGRQAYEQFYGPEAERELKTAIATGDTQAISQVCRRFPFTASGNEAAYLGAVRAMDHGEFRDAVMILRDLRRSAMAREQLDPELSLQLAWSSVMSGATDDVAPLFDELSADYDSAFVSWHGDRQSMSDVLQALKASQSQATTVQAAGTRWMMLGGGPSHNAATNGSLPLGNPTWRQPLTASAPLRDALWNALSRVRDRGDPLVPSSSPLVVGNLVLSRGLDNEIRALDLATGDIRWKTGFHQPGDLPAPQSENAAWDRVSLEERLWFDGITSQLTSDGQRVFSVEQSWALHRIPVGLSDGGAEIQLSLDTFPSNQLSAYDLATQGKLVWQLKGNDPRLDQERGVYFLSAPLLLGQELFVLGESATGEVRLYSLEPATGDIRYSQYLLTNEYNLETDPLRKLAGATLAGDGNLVVCPTSAGTMVAFDRMARQLLWGYSYESNEINVNPRNGIRVNVSKESQELDRRRWRINAPRIAGDRVFYTPTDSNDLHCLRLTDGELLWRYPAEDRLFLAGIRNDQAIVVGASGVTAVSVFNGESQWHTDWPDAQRPSGLGYFNDTHYFQPLGNSVVSLALHDGGLTETSVGRREAQPGNLVVTADGVISQSAFGVEHYARWDQIGDLSEASPRDLSPSDLITRSEIRLHAGQLAQAIEDLEICYEEAKTDTARELLLDAYLRAIEENPEFIKLERVDALVKTPRERTRYSFALAKGQLAAGDRLGAFRGFLEVPLSTHADSAGGGEHSLWPQSSIDFQATPEVNLSFNAYLTWRLADLQSQASDADREDLQQFVDKASSEARQVLAQADAEPAARAKALETLSRLSTYLPHRQDAPGEQLILLQSQTGQLSRLAPAELLRREVQLEDLALSETPELAGPATALLADLYRQVEDWDSLVRQTHRLQDKFADVVCSPADSPEGPLLGRAIADELARLPEVQQRLTAGSWPDLTLSSSRSSQGVLSSTEYPLEWDAPVGTALDGWRLRLSLQDNTLIGTDEFGRERFQCHLGSQLTSPPNFAIYWAQQAWSHGHLLIYSTGSQIFGIDVLNLDSSGEAPLLWSEELVSWPPSQNSYSFNSSVTPWGTMRTRVASPSGAPLAAPSYVHSQLVCGIFGEMVVGMDPFTGSRIWARRSANAVNGVLGGPERVVLFSDNSNAAEVVDAATGVKLADATGLAERDVMFAHGNQLVEWRAEGTDVTIRSIVPGEDTVNWAVRVAQGSKAADINGQVIAVIQTNWAYKLIRAADGAILATGEIPQSARAEDANVQYVFAQLSGDHYVVAAGYNAPRADDNIQRTSVSDGINSILLRGTLLGFSRQKVDAREAGDQPGWAMPLEGLTLLRGQPPRLPVVMLACRIYDRVGNSLKNNRTEFLVIDTRNGSVVAREQVAGSTAAFRLTASEDRDVITLRSSLMCLEFRFAEQPVAATPAAH